jgi:hypothetical protein
MLPQGTGGKTKDSLPQDDSGERAKKGKRERENKRGETHFNAFMVFGRSAIFALSAYLSSLIETKTRFCPSLLLGEGKLRE